MEVNIIPLSGCLQVVLGIFTLGVAPLAIWLQERSWPKIVDDQGLVTRGGKRFAWDEFTKIVLVKTAVTRGSAPTVEHYELQSRNGKVKVVVYRLENGPQVLDYVWQHLPAQAKAAA